MSEMNEYTGRRPFIDPRNFWEEWGQIFESCAYSAGTLEEALEAAEYLRDFDIETRVRVEEEEGFAAMLRSISEEPLQDQYKVYVRNSRGRDARGASQGQEPSMKRDWSKAFAKLETEGRCRACGDSSFLDMAHLAPRRFDAKVIGPRGGKTLYVDPNNIIPLCGSWSTNNCHSRFDAHELDLSTYLTEEEKQHCIEVLGKGRAMRRITGDRDLLEACWSGLERADG